MKKIFFSLVLMGVLLISPAVFADTISGSGGANWQSWVSANENGKPYWDNGSSDGGQKNVGYWMTNTGAFVGGTEGPGAKPFWGMSYSSGDDGATNPGTFDPSFYFNKESPSMAALKIEIAGLAGSNVFGWYDTSTGARTVIFTGPQSAGATATFTPSATYGFYLDTGSNIFLTQSGDWNTADPGNQHFAVFKQTVGDPMDIFWIGMEDLLFSGSDKDYNDMIVKVTPVPEPATMLLLGSGLIGLAGFARRRFKK